MLQVARWRIILVAVVTILGVLIALPNLLTERQRELLPDFLPKQAINLGLDLQGGSHLLLEVDVPTLRRAQLENIADSMGAALRDASPTIRFSGRGVVGETARVRLLDAADAPRAMTALRAIVEQVGNEPNLSFTQGADGLIEARMNEAALRQLSRQAAQQSIEVIRRRVDPTGTSEVSIQRQGDDRIVVQAPGMSDPEELKSRIGQTALMTFHLVDDSVDPSEIAAGRIPPGTLLAPPYPQIGDSAEVVRRRPSLSGEHLTRAMPTVDPQTNGYVLSFALDSEGARIFCRLTTEYTDRRFAILLDNQVLTAPRINEPICGGSGQITGNFTAQSANELAVMVSAGALPAPLTVVEQRSVGAELGQDAIEAGQVSTALAGILVLVFMVLAYGFLFGGISVIALAVNGILIMAAMTLLGAALTLPGVAGLILTLAVALDANVLIYERMRDEVRAGRSPALAIDAGFSRAMVTIFDANITHLGAAMIMLSLAPPGPVKGFAWTLTIGVFTSVFTAVLITQVLVAWWFKTTRPKTLPIA